MTFLTRTSLALGCLLALAGTAAAQVESGPAATPDPTSTTPAAPDQQPPPGPKEPKAGDFDAGGQLRLPNGPDEMDVFKTFNWVAFDGKGKYYILKWLTVEGTVPLAVKKPDMLSDGTDPRLFGGMSMQLVAKLPTMNVPFAPKSKDSEVSLTLGGAYMREGAMLLGEKDYPKYVGGFEPGFDAGLAVKVKLGSVVDFKLLPVVMFQKGGSDGLQVPTSLIIGLGSLLKVSADVGLYTGDGFSVRPSKGGRLALGGALDVKISKIIVHAGAGAASLLTGGLYPTIGDSVYFDLNVKFAK